MYQNGRGVPQSFEEGARFYRASAEQGFPPAQYMLDLMYGKGQGVPQDYVLAYMWFNLAGSFGAQLGNKHRDALAPRMTSGQIAEAQKFSREWKPVAPGAAQAQ